MKSMLKQELSGWVDFVPITKILFAQYNSKTPKKLKIIDCFLVFNILVLLLNIAFRFVKGPNPLHSILAASFFALGEFALACALRIQLSSDQFKHVSEKKAFTEFFVGSMILTFFSMNYVG